MSKNLHGKIFFTIFAQNFVNLHKMDTKRIGQYINIERSKCGFSLYRLSRLSGVSIRHLHMIEDGKHDVRVSTLQKILKPLCKRLTIIDV